MSGDLDEGHNTDVQEIKKKKTVVLKCLENDYHHVLQRLILNIILYTNTKEGKW